MRAERSLPAGLGLPPASRENGLALWEQTEDSVGGEAAAPRSAAAPFLWHSAGLEAREAPAVGGPVSEARARRGRTEGRRQEGPTQKGSELYRGPSWHHGGSGGEGDQVSQ